MFGEIRAEGNTVVGWSEERKPKERMGAEKEEGEERLGEGQGDGRFVKGRRDGRFVKGKGGGRRQGGGE